MLLVGSETGREAAGRLGLCNKVSAGGRRTSKPPLSSTTAQELDSSGAGAGPLGQQRRGAGRLRGETGKREERGDGGGGRLREGQGSGEDGRVPRPSLRESTAGPPGEAEPRPPRP